jgi:protein tyrosine phosphatase
MKPIGPSVLPSTGQEQGCFCFNKLKKFFSKITDLFISTNNRSQLSTDRNSLLIIQTPATKFSLISTNLTVDPHVQKDPIDPVDNLEAKVENFKIGITERLEVEENYKSVDQEIRFRSPKAPFYPSQLLENYIEVAEVEEVAKKQLDQTDKTLSENWIVRADNEFKKIHTNSNAVLFEDNGYVPCPSKNDRNPAIFASFKKDNDSNEFFAKLFPMVEDPKKTPIYNRYTNIISLNNNIVRPTQEWYKSDIKESDLTKFYVDGSKVKVNNYEFFVTAAPTSFNLKNFCLMVQKENIGLWVCLTNTIEQFVRKADGFWEEQQPIYFASELVQTLNFENHEENQPGLIFKNVEITTKDGQSKAEFIQYLEWPDHGAPSTKTALEAMRKIIDKAIQIKSEGKNIVLHCSAGVGRACTFTVAISIIQHLKTTLDKNANPREALKNIEIDVSDTVFQLRKQRHTTAVRTEKQYRFIYIAIAYWLEAYLKTREQGPLPDFVDTRNNDE